MTIWNLHTPPFITFSTRTFYSSSARTFLHLCALKCIKVHSFTVCLKDEPSNFLHLTTFWQGTLSYSHMHTAQFVIKMSIANWCHCATVLYLWGKRLMQFSDFVHQLWLNCFVFDDIHQSGSVGWNRKWHEMWQITMKWCMTMKTQMFAKVVCTETLGLIFRL